MFLSAVSVLVVARSSSEFPEGLMNNPVNVCMKILFEKRILAKISCKLCHQKIHNNQFLAAILVLKLPQRCS